MPEAQFEPTASPSAVSSQDITSKDELLTKLPSDFLHEITDFKFRSTEDGHRGFFVVLRINFEEADQFRTWLREFENETQTHWTVVYSVPDVRRYLFRQSLACQHFRAFRSSKRTGCPAKLDIWIKRNSPRIRYTDSYANVGLFGIIKLLYLHNHPVGTAEAVQWLPIRPEVKLMFRKYFEAGIKPSAAREKHLQTLGRSNQLAVKRLTDPSMAPTLQQVNSLYQIWRKGPRTKTAASEKGVGKKKTNNTAQKDSETQADSL